MRLVCSYLLVITLFLSVAQAQEIISDVHREDFRSVILDFIDVKNQELKQELDSIQESSNSTRPITAEDIELLKRSKSLTKVIPLEYNDQVKFFIDKYTSNNYRPYMNRLLGLSKHYFPIYESILEESGLPEEVKYLSLVESSLNPHLVSTSGAVGPWQFMYITAKEFNLEMSSFADERKDAYSSSYAVSQYIMDAYRQFGDWLVALASYNCGRGCVQRAIARSGFEQPTFWQLAPFLPQETRNYIPKYIAMTYVLSDAEYYGIVADETELDMAHKVVFVDKVIDMQAVAEAVGIPQEALKKYNPAYKRSLINGSIEKPKRLILPLTNQTNDSLLYVALHTNKVLINEVDSRYERALASATGVSKYKARRGETLTSISRKFGVSVQNLRAWNGLSARSSIVGKTLIVERPVNEKLVDNVKSAVHARKSNSTIVYTVKPGDSLDRIANKYNGVTVSTLKADNGLKSNLIKPGMKLKIKQGKG